MPRTVAQLDTLLTPYLGRGSRTGTTTTLAALNLVLPRLYTEGDWKQLKKEYSVDVSSGYFCLEPEWECVLSASLWEVPMTINDIEYQTKTNGPGRIVRPVSGVYGLIDRGYFPIMSEVPEDGIDELIFSCESASFASGDTATITYRDTEEGYTQVVLPLHTITVAATGGTAISIAADGGTDATTGEVLTTLTVSSSASLVAGMSLTLSQLTGTDATYIGTFRIHSAPSGTTVKIVKAYVALTGTLAAVTIPQLLPVSTIESVESIAYAGLPGRTLVKDADDIQYAILIPGSGVASFRRYECPQVPEEIGDDDDWTVRAVVKRAFIPMTAATDIVYLDNVSALTAAILSVVARDGSDHDREEQLWRRAVQILDKDLFDTKGGVIQRPVLELWGEGIPGLSPYY